MIYTKTTIPWKSVFLSSLNEKTKISKFWIKSTNWLYQQRYLHAKRLRLKYYCWTNMWCIRMQWWSIPFLWKKPLCIHPNKYFFEIVQLSLICENLQKLLDYFDIKKVSTYFFTIQRVTAMTITFYITDNYEVDLWSENSQIFIACRRRQRPIPIAFKNFKIGSGYIW